MNTNLRFASIKLLYRVSITSTGVFLLLFLWFTIVANIAGAATGPNSLAPVITTQPASQTSVAGTTVSFTVTATGRHPYFYQWCFNGTNNPVLDATNATLILTNVELAQAGSYSVAVSNPLGSTLSSNAVLTVNPEPTNLPQVFAFSPMAGAAASEVSITGTNFSPLAAENTVYFGAVKAAVESAGATNLVVLVPAGATYAPITVTVHGLTAYASQPFLPVFPGGASLSAASFMGPTNLTTGNQPVRVAIGDLDGDGKPDVVVVNYGDGTLSVYRNISTNGSLTSASLASPVVLPIPGAGTSLLGLTLADLSGDGRLDIVVADYHLNEISLFQNLSSPGSLTTNSFGARVDFAVGGAPTSVAVADLDGDGHPDIVTANQAGNTVSVLRNLGAGGLLNTNSFAAPVSFATGINPMVVVIADLDGDGRPDIATVNQNDLSHKVSLLRNLGTPGGLSTNSFAPAVGLAGADKGEALAVGDLDGDGRPDLLVGSSSGQTIAVYRNVSTPGSLTASSFATPVVFPTGANVHTVAIGDLDGDGRPDVALVTEAPSRLSLFKNLSTPGTFTTASLGARIDLPAGNDATGVVIGDLDGDGRPDLAFGNFYDSTLSLYHNVVPLPAPPVITAQPVSQTVTVGDTAGFTVTATGPGTLSYQWFFNQATPLADATNATLILTNVELAQAGSYSVAVSNPLGSTLSSNAVLTVNDPLNHFGWSQIASPRFVGTPFAVTIKALDVNNGILTNFTGSVLLSTTNGAAVTPPVSANFVQGVWSGSLTITQPVTNLVLSASNGLGVIGLSGPINVVSPPSLGMVQSSGFMLLYWPVASSNFVLETTPELFPARWTPVTTPPFQIGNQYLESIQITSTNSFYRLRFTGQ